MSTAEPDERADPRPGRSAEEAHFRVVCRIEGRPARRHPMTFLRRGLSELEIRPIETCYRFGQTVRLRPGRSSGSAPVVTVAGLSILRQRPPTAGGTRFLTLEDETGMIQGVMRPHVLNYLDHVLRAGSLIVRGRLHLAGNRRVAT